MPIKEKNLFGLWLFWDLSCRGIGPFGPDVVHKYTSARFGAYSSGEVLSDEETRLLTGIFKRLICWSLVLSGYYDLTVIPSCEDYVYHTLVARPSGELCMKHIFAFGAFTRVPLLQRYCSSPLNLYNGVYRVVIVLHLIIRWLEITC